jgi:hypothetical protein
MTACRYSPDHGRRILPGRHDDDCTGGCDGCQPCTERHCGVCGRGHCDDQHPQTCPECVGLVREHLTAIVDMSERLEDEAVACHADGRLNTGPLGGDAMVMLAEGRYLGAKRLSAEERRNDPLPPLLVLATWEDDWRIELGHGGGPRATLWRCADYLGTHLTMMAQRHCAFDEFAADLARLVGRLEAVLHDGDKPERAEAVCLKCSGTLIRPVTDRGISDYWHCTHCRRQLSTEDYNLALADFTRAHLATAAALATRFGVEPTTIRQWATRGHIKRWGTDSDGRTLYRIGEVQRYAQRHEQGA